MLDETVNKFSNNVSTHKLTNTSLAEKKDVCFFHPIPVSILTQYNEGFNELTVDRKTAKKKTVRLKN